MIILYEVQIPGREGTTLYQLDTENRNIITNETDNLYVGIGTDHSFRELINYYLRGTIIYSIKEE